MRRVFTADKEWMDLPFPSEAELQSDLRNLEKINCYFGGGAAVLRLLQQCRPSKQALIIDLATGFGDHPRRMTKWAREAGLSIRVVGVDYQARTLRLAQAATTPRDSIFYTQGDIRRLPFQDKSAEIVFCNLALHHFSESEAVHILREARRVASGHVICMDLERSWMGSLGAWLLTALWMTEPMTRHDARMSVQRAYSGQELKNLACSAGWGNFWHIRLPWFRQAIGLSLEDS